MFGDALIAKCEYGRIWVRKAGGDVRLVTTGRVKDVRTGVFSPKVWLWGDWLRDIGFPLDSLVAIASGPGCITLTAQGEAALYSDAVRFARQTGSRLIKVSAKAGKVNIHFSGVLVSRAGFAIGDMLAAEYEYGAIKLQRFDPERFGF
jgi:hypothetical protein